MRQWLQVATEVRQQELALAVLRHTGSGAAGDLAGRAGDRDDGRRRMVAVGRRAGAGSPARRAFAGAMTAYDVLAGRSGGMVLSVAGGGRRRSGRRAAGRRSRCSRSGIVRAVAFSPDGTRVATAAEQDSLMLWPVDGGEPADARDAGARHRLRWRSRRTGGRSSRSRGRGSRGSGRSRGSRARRSLADGGQCVRRAWFARGRAVTCWRSTTTTRSPRCRSAGGEPRALPGTLVGRVGGWAAIRHEGGADGHAGAAVVDRRAVAVDRGGFAGREGRSVSFYLAGRREGRWRDYRSEGRLIGARYRGRAGPRSCRCADPRRSAVLAGRAARWSRRMRRRGR
jgi:hypothetical protein